MKSLPWRAIGRHLLSPALLYSIFFALYTWPWLSHFSSHFFGDAGDGLQNAWNLWWMRDALANNLNPWSTTALHFPHGTTLLGHTLNPINGFLGALLQDIGHLSLVQTYNTIVTLAFVGTGLTTFWFCYAITRSYLGSLFGGFVFTFSAYHFAHAIGHMNLITLQFVPLFLWAWHTFLQKMDSRSASNAAIALLLVSLSDFYYLLYAVIAASIMAVWFAVTREINLKARSTWKALAVFLGLSSFLVGPLVLAVIRANRQDPFLGSHNPLDYGSDILSPFIPGQIWRFADLTSWHWSTIHLGIVEGSISLGLLVLLSYLAAVVWRKKFGKDALLWASLGLIFLVLSIGPYIHLMGQIIENIPMPYALIVRIFPVIALAGVPVRMAMMASLAGSVLVAYLISHLRPTLKKPLHILGLGLAAAIVILEAWPTTLPLTAATVPQWVDILHVLPEGAAIDQVSTRTEALYRQTVHGKPILGGYISRVPASVDVKDTELLNFLAANNYTALRSRGLRYLIVPSDQRRALSIAYRDDAVVIYDLGH